MIAKRSLMPRLTCDSLPCRLGEGLNTLQFPLLKVQMSELAPIGDLEAKDQLQNDELSINTDIILDLEHEQTIFSNPSLSISHTEEEPLKPKASSRSASEKTMK